MVVIKWLDAFNQSTEAETRLYDNIESEVPRPVEILQSDSDSVSESEIELKVVSLMVPQC